MPWPGFALLLVLGLWLSPQPLRAETPRVVATIPPIHALVAAVMEGRGTPQLLLPGATSPHATALRPSQARMLEQAELVIWVGPSLESFLARPLTRLSQRAQLVGLLELDGLVLLPPRHAGAWDGEDHAHHDHGAEETAAVDPHLWLDPTNAKAIARAVAGELAALDPAGRDTYLDNATQLVERLDSLDRALIARLAPLRDQAYAVFHDAYQYFEARYGLSPIGSVTLSAELKPGARRIAELRRRIVEAEAVCLFSEPQIPSDLVAVLLEDTTLRHAVLDPLGTALPPGPEAYFAMMENLAANLTDCLTATGS